MALLVDSIPVEANSVSSLMERLRNVSLSRHVFSSLASHIFTADAVSRQMLPLRPLYTFMNQQQPNRFS
jgi:hypothetical protein